MNDTIAFEAVLLLHTDYRTKELLHVSVLELTGKCIPIDAINYLETDDCAENDGEVFEDFPLDEPFTTKLTMEYEPGDTSVGLWPGWMVINAERIDHE